LPCHAQTIRVVDTQGKVLVKKSTFGPWFVPEKDIILDKDAEVKTESASFCIISFDTGLDNIILLAKDTHLSIEKNKPLVFHVLNGEVFFFIDETTKVADFEIRAAFSRIDTKGAGTIVNVSGQKVTVKCFEDSLKIALVKQEDKAGGLRILEEGYGVTVKSSGVFGDFFELSDYDFSRWEEFINSISLIRADKGYTTNIEKKPD
jgi:hypothetical protein